MKPDWCPQPDGWRYRYEVGKWTVQKNKPAWYRDHMVDVELEPLFSQGVLIEAHQRGRQEGMEEAGADIAERLRLRSLAINEALVEQRDVDAAVLMSCDLPNIPASAIRAKMEEQP